MKVAREFRPDAIVLDIMLPDIDGLEVLQRVRADGAETPVLFLTAKDSLDDRIAGLTAGGDDYVTKPFSLEEVVARLRGLIRRSTLTLAQAKDPVLVVGDLTLDEDSYEVVRDGDADRAHRDRVRAAALPHAQPAPRALEGADPRPRVAYDFGGKESVVELYISYLRKKIDAGREPMIHTVRGAGYMLKAAG